MRKVEVTIDIAAPAEQVLAAFLDPKQLKEWWQVERTLIDPRPGGVYTLAWKITSNGFGYVTSGTIKEITADSMMVHNMVYLNPQRPMLGPMSLAISAKSNQQLVELYICQSGYRTGPHWDWYYQAVKEAWPQLAHVLKDYLERKNV